MQNLLPKKFSYWGNYLDERDFITIGTLGRAPDYKLPVLPLADSTINIWEYFDQSDLARVGFVVSAFLIANSNSIYWKIANHVTAIYGMYGCFYEIRKVPGFTFEAYNRNQSSATNISVQLLCIEKEAYKAMHSDDLSIIQNENAQMRDELIVTPDSFRVDSD